MDTVALIADARVVYRNAWHIDPAAVTDQYWRGLAVDVATVVDRPSALHWFDPYWAALARTVAAELDAAPVPPPDAAPVPPPDAATLTWDRWCSPSDPNAWWQASSGNYRRVTDLIDYHRCGRLRWSELSARLCGLGLVDHPLGCDYLMWPPPMPPPGIRTDPRIMPDDCAGTVGELVKAYDTGLLSGTEWSLLHAAVHPGCGARPTGQRARS